MDEQTWMSGVQREEPPTAILNELYRIMAKMTIPLPYVTSKHFPTEGEDVPIAIMVPLHGKGVLICHPDSFLEVERVAQLKGFRLEPYEITPEEIMEDFLRMYVEGLMKRLATDVPMFHGGNDGKK